MEQQLTQTPAVPCAGRLSLRREARHPSSNGQCFQLEAHVAFLLPREGWEFIALRSGWREVGDIGVRRKIRTRQGRGEGGD